LQNIHVKLFPPRKNLISDIPAGDGKTTNSFLQCIDTKLERTPGGCLEAAWTCITRPNIPRIGTIKEEKKTEIQIIGYRELLDAETERYTIRKRSFNDVPLKVIPRM
jgi:hypothetical protein